MRYPLKLLVVNDQQLHRHPEGWRGESWQEFANQISAHFERATLWAPVVAGGGANYDRWRLEHLAVAPAQFSASFVGYLRALVGSAGPVIVRTAARLVREHDVVLMRLPSMGFPLIAGLCRHYRVPVAVAVTGDVVQSNRYAQSRYGAVRALGRGLGYAVRLTEKIGMGLAVDLAMVYSEASRPSYAGWAKRIWLTREGSIARRDITYRDDTCCRPPYRILQVAYYHQNKNHALLLRAAALLLGRGWDLEVHLAGEASDPGVANLIARAKREPPLAGRVHEHGLLKKNDLYALYRRCDVLTLTSRSEGWPRVLLEGASFGLPVVATAVGGVPTFIRDERDGLLVAPDDPEVFARAVERVITERELRQQLIRNGYENARHDCRESVVERWAAEISGLVQGNRSDEIRLSSGEPTR